MVLGLNNTLGSVKERITVLLAHKICHQWFGDLVTAKWWNYVWLNEGFCVYSSYAVIDKVDTNQIESVT